MTFDYGFVTVKKFMDDSIFPSLGNDIIMADMIFVMHHSIEMKLR